MRKYLPWYLKIITKIILSRVPVPYRKWSNMGLFKHGEMADPDYALKVFFNHYTSVFGQSYAEGKIFLEMGPGDSVASALCAASMGAKKIYILDVNHFATHDMDFYCRVAASLRERGLTPPAIIKNTTFSELLESCHAEYLTEGLSSLSRIPDECVDYAWSHSMMEHVRKKEFLVTVRQQHRVMKAGGIVSHSIDLQDHLGGRLNNLRFSEKIWESEFMANSGFYTNRLRASWILDIFEKAGFTIKEKRAGKWETIPVPRHKLAKPFDTSTEEDLLIRTLSVKLQKS